MYQNNENLQLPTVLIVVDVSGSMENQLPIVREKLKSLYGHLQDNGVAKTCLIPFSDYYSIENDPSPYTISRLRSGGGTNLFGTMVTAVQELLQTRSTRDKCLIVVITDGGDTAHKASTSEVAAQVHVAEETMGWDFLFIGTNQDAYNVGNTLGIKPGKALSFSNTAEGFEKMLDSLTGITHSWCSGHISHDADFFTEEVKEEQARLGAIRI